MTAVLVIDDNPNTADALKEMVEIFDVKAQAAYGARSGLVLLRKERPALVLIDLNMPGLSGEEVIRFIRRDVRLQDVPVVVITSEDQAAPLEQARQAGANDVLTKPVTLQQIEGILRRFKLL
jgi:CheY-like chemotaxis protein